MNSLLDQPQVASVLAELHALSDRQARSSMRPLSIRRRLRGWLGLAMNWDCPAIRRRLADQLVALDPDKARACYLLCRAIGARTVVEVGTSFGVSTIYLAAAVRENGSGGVVIGTEWEAAKVAAARHNLDRAGLSAVVDVREGDIRDTLANIGGEIDFVLMDIWAPLARPALDLLEPKLRPGAMVACDNVERFRHDYRVYLDRVRDPNGGFVSTTLPYDGGFELSVWLPGAAWLTGRSACPR